MDGKKYNISVCIIARPKDDISRCLASLRQQTYPPMEIVVHRELGSFSKLRNKVIDKAHGEIIAFTDSDCTVEKHWLEEINQVFKNKSILGCYGKVCYELGGKTPTISTRLVSNKEGALLTSNAAFRADIIKKVRFDEEINYLEDIILFIKMQQIGKIIYAPALIVFHDYQEWNFKRAVLYAKKIEDFIKANEKYNIPLDKFGPIVNPLHYLIILFPPILFLFHSIRNFKDIKIAIAVYIEKVYTRLLIWKYAILHRKFLI
jgi:GT2 family glycosyltransferase